MSNAHDPKPAEQRSATMSTSDSVSYLDDLESSDSEVEVDADEQLPMQDVTPTTYGKCYTVPLDHLSERYLCYLSLLSTLFADWANARQSSRLFEQ
jgi:hypothetical protein